ncbi:hypothetical protein [Geodermatophilus africanus]|uniref:SLOG cluster 4 domain-containing protein n=1 Tax=Geodermatophilus africanus TaxID=1137993 RepID=UPI0011148231|nr:hypothetical protein [Geodermatophilus africanus]
MAALGLVAGGMIVLALFGGRVDWGEELGSTLLSAGLFAAVWQVAVDRWQRQALAETLRSVMTETEAGLALQEVRIRDIARSDLEKMLRGAQELSAVCLFDSRWLDPWAPVLNGFVAAGGRARFCAPDPEDGRLMAMLAGRHNFENPVDFQIAVRKLLDRIGRLATAHPDRVQVRTVVAPGPSYTAYLMLRDDGRGVGMTRMYNHRMHEGRQLVEKTFAQGGDLFAHHQDDFQSLWSKAGRYPRLSRRSDLGVRIGVIGPGTASADIRKAAHDVGRLLGNEADVVIVGGGLRGVMEAAPAGAKAARADARCVGYLPGLDLREANEFITEPIATGLGEGRDLALVDDCDAVIAIGFNEGTLMEAAYARKMGVPVYGIHFPVITMPDGLPLVQAARGPKPAVSSALKDARSRARA